MLKQYFFATLILSVLGEIDSIEEFTSDLALLSTLKEAGDYSYISFQKRPWFRSEIRAENNIQCMDDKIKFIMGDTLKLPCPCINRMRIYQKKRHWRERAKPIWEANGEEVLQYIWNSQGRHSNRIRDELYSYPNRLLVVFPSPKTINKQHYEDNYARHRGILFNEYEKYWIEFRVDDKCLGGFLGSICKFLPVSFSPMWDFVVRDCGKKRPWHWVE